MSTIYCIVSTKAVTIIQNPTFARISKQKILFFKRINFLLNVHPYQSFFGANPYRLATENTLEISELCED